jgi:acyl-ACP thioesterase
VKYIEHVIDLWPLAWYKEHRLKRFEIAYVAESHEGDRLSFYREKLQTNGQIQGFDAEGDVFCVRIVRSDGTETCRAQLLFVDQ